MSDSSELSDLTFVTRQNDGKLSLWTPERPSDYEAGYAAGQDYADELIVYMRATNNSQVFGAVVRAITAGGTYEAVEIGFCHALGMELVGLAPMKPPVGGAVTRGAIV